MLKTGTEILVEAHEDRIQELERSTSAFNVQILPALARLEAHLASGFEKVSESIERGDEKINAIERKLDSVEPSIAILTIAHENSQNRKKAFVKWGVSLVGTLVVAALLAILGLS